MSILSLSGLTAADPALGQSALPPINPALEPAQVRNGPPAAKQAYEEALGFEEMLVDQLSREMVSTISSTDGSDDGSDDSGDDSTGDSTDGAGGLMGSDPATSEYAQMLPGVLTSSIMSGGGMGVALKLATALDPALANPQSQAGSGKPSSEGAKAASSSGGRG